MISEDFRIPVFVDNLACKAYAEKISLPPRIKHVDVRFHAVRRWVTNNWYSVHWISTVCNVADMLTKALPCTRKGAPCLLFLTSLILDVGFSFQNLSPAQQKYSNLFQDVGPPPTGFTLTDFHKQDSSFPQCPVQINVDSKITSPLVH